MWRLLERELVDLLRSEGLSLSEDHTGDKVVVHGDLIILNITELAKALLDHGVKVAS